MAWIAAGLLLTLAGMAGWIICLVVERDDYKAQAESENWARLYEDALISRGGVTDGKEH